MIAGHCGIISPGHCGIISPGHCGIISPGHCGIISPVISQRECQCRFLLLVNDCRTVWQKITSHFTEEV